MPKFPAHLIGDAGNLRCLLCVVAGLLMTAAAAAGGRCADGCPGNLLRLSHTLIRLIGRRFGVREDKSAAKEKPKRLYFTHGLFETTTTPRNRHFFPVSSSLPEDLARETHQRTTTDRCIPAKRIYYVFFCTESRMSVWTLCGGVLKAHAPPDPLRWLASFGGGARARGDLVFLLVSGKTGRVVSAFRRNVTAVERKPAAPGLGVAVLLSVILLWTSLPTVAFCVLICVGWELLRRTRTTDVPY